MKTSHFLTIANFGTAFGAVQIYGQCGGGSFNGDTDCPSGSTCVAANEWYSQCVPSSQGGEFKAPSHDVAVTPTVSDDVATVTDVANDAADDAADDGQDENQDENQDQEEEEGDNEDDNAGEGEGEGEGQVETTASVNVGQPTTETAAPIDTVTPTKPADDGEADNESTSAAAAELTSAPGSGGITRTIPASSGAVASSTAIPVSGEFDGEMKYFDRSPAVCKDQSETSEKDAMFILEDGATIRNVIIGAGQAEGIHCKGICTIENVWFEDVCEDAITLKQESGTSFIKGGGAFHASDKVVQFNGRGTVEISDFYVEDYGKLVRSCGNCKGNGGPRNVVIDNVAAVDGGVLCGINTNYGDTCTISNTCQDSGKNCDLFEGNDTGDEPSKLSSGPDGTSCKLDSFSETC